MHKKNASKDCDNRDNDNSNNDNDNTISMSMSVRMTKSKTMSVTMMIMVTMITILPGVLKTELPEIVSEVQHNAGNISKLNLLKALILLV